MVSSAFRGTANSGAFELETPTLIRYGELTKDEYFVSESAAKEGITITNTSDENIVLLKHFAYNPDLKDISNTL